MSTETESYILLEEQDPDYAGSDSWWRKGRYAAASAEEAIRAAYKDSYLTPNRSGHLRKHVAVTGPGHLWQEFDVILTARPAEIASIKPSASAVPSSGGRG
jgi:hypothetical protein